MITSEVKVQFNYDEDGKRDLAISLRTIKEIREEFEKAGTYNETEIETLKATEHIVNEIQRGETF